MEYFNSDGARTGLFFGATSGVITTIGLIVGLNSGTRSITAVLGGILVIAVADAMSDALGIHLAEESDPDTDHSHVWSATIMTFAGCHRVGDLGLVCHRRAQLLPCSISGRVAVVHHR
jgi:hypothetical protein